MVAYRVVSVLAINVAASLRLIPLAARIVVLLALSVGLFPTPARAFLDPPYITPANPTVGAPISVNIYGGVCDIADMGIVWPPPVTQEGNEITISFTGIHETDLEWCYFSIGTESYPVGAYQAGSYVLNVERRYTSGTGVWIYETLGVIPFAVAGPFPSKTEAAPALGVVGASALLIGLIVFAAGSLRSKAMGTLTIHLFFKNCQSGGVEHRNPYPDTGASLMESRYGRASRCTDAGSHVRPAYSCSRARSSTQRYDRGAGHDGAWRPHCR